MIQPTIGRVVWFYPVGHSHEHPPVPALICFVHSDEFINVGGFDQVGQPINGQSVPLIQEGQDTPPGQFACWMPYQQKQAAENKEKPVF